jgi:protein SCO1/2
MKSQKKSHTKTVFTILVVFISVAIGIITFGSVRKQTTTADVSNIKIDGTYLPQTMSLTPFSLSSTSGKTFTNADLKGHWTFMFFGFTNCGMVCPTTMSELNKMYKVLQGQLPQDKLPQVMMVSVDPDRDTVARMKDYVTAFNPNFIGARAEIAQINDLEKQLHLVAVKMQSGEGKDQYTINHSAEIMVFNPHGELQAFLSYPHMSDEMVEDYKKMLAVS